MKLLYFLLILLLVIYPSNSQQNASTDKDWWKNAVFYQLNVRSFRDSNNDGIGDINGIIEKLSYFNKIGVNSLCLSSIFQSTQFNFGGQDIIDFYQIHSEYGTINDFQKLINEAKKIGIKIIIEFIPNHTSDQHIWFKKSIMFNSIYKDFYVWHNGRRSISFVQSPSNWISFYGNSTWEWNDKRKQFYLHQFSKYQPDLNLRNQDVLSALKKILRYWFDTGIHGIFIKNIPFLYEIRIDDDGGYRDEPLSGRTNVQNDYNYLDHIYTYDQNETLQLVFEWRQLLNDYQMEAGKQNDQIIVAELNLSHKTIMKYYGNESFDGIHIPLNFDLLSRIDRHSNAYDIKNSIDDWLNNMPNGRIASWQIGNYDTSRIGSRLGIHMIDSMNMILLTLPGAAFTYYGEEIGMTDEWISWNDTVDPIACNTNLKNYHMKSRDPMRTPFQWDGKRNSGFSNGVVNMWLPIASNYKENNVRAQLLSNQSHLKIYMNLIKLKQTKTLRYGSLETVTINQNIFGIIRKLHRNYAYVTLINIGHRKEIVNLSSLGIADDFQYFIVSVNSNNTIGQNTFSPTFFMEPYESVVLKTMKKYYNKNS